MKTRLLLLDIETAPTVAYVWKLFKENVGLKQIIEPGYTLCWAAKWLGEKEMHSARIGDADFLSKIHDLISEADAVVHYNGARFDMPTLNREFVKAGMTPPSTYAQIDLLRTVRSQFRFVSNKLDHVVQELGLGKKQETSFSDWVGCIEGNEKSWRKMERYNKNDVRILEKLYKRLLAWIPNHPNVNVIEDREEGCPKCSSKKLQKRGFHLAKTLKYQRYQCQACGGWCRSRKAVDGVRAQVR